jgi:hypothetical protein
MTGVEAAERDANKREQTETRGKRSQATKEAAEEEEAAEEATEEEEAAEEAFRPPPSTAPAALALPKAGRKRVPIMKALEGEMVPKRSMAQAQGGKQGRGGRGRGKRGDRGSSKWRYGQNTVFFTSAS